MTIAPPAPMATSPRISSGTVAVPVNGRLPLWLAAGAIPPLASAAPLLPELGPSVPVRLSASTDVVVVFLEPVVGSVVSVTPATAVVVVVAFCVVVVVVALCAVVVVVACAVVVVVQPQ